MKYVQVQTLIQTALEIATARKQNIAVAVVDTHGELLGFARMDDVSVQAGLLAQNKAYTSARDRQHSGNLGAWARETGKQLSYWTDPKITGFMGGVPIEQEGKIVGAIGISGLAEQDDEALAMEVLNAR
ncbi:MULTISPECIES: GlcG/HbpS family heme-binding protein [Vibrio]|uniref:GlcG/HbpS family heme-binding protein n=1 Tax=Vibrio TaxID=662 RepID=UPI000DFAE4BD|nr:MULTISPECIES: heme-binding protein [Vibrio]ELB2760238.1 heme-binding protein [Vibrio alginolyticus]MBS9890694.1 heme-binding protein [Vibrio alginolyticus]MDW2090155.1 heme-binding protein [Vibrio sp. 1866]MDW3100284.1 heme-binding protein [Vibrio sp. 1874]MDW3197913.1 heme-binding protein [Vibrio sp. 1865]